MKKSLIYILVIVLFASCQDSKVIFEDNFNGNSLDEASWNFELGDGCPNCGWGNNERQLYTKDNVKVENGHLIITAEKSGDNYTSSRITTKDKVEFKYGIVEARLKLATGQGVWPAFWMLGADFNEKGWPACGEIDIMEYVGKQQDTIYTSLHTADSYGETINSRQTEVKGIEEGFHTYKADWTKNSIIFSIDDAVVYTFSPEEKNDETWPFDKPFFVLLNLAVGGNFGGPEVDDSIFPQEYIVDYIKVYKH